MLLRKDAPRPVDSLPLLPSLPLVYKPGPKARQEFEAGELRGELHRKLSLSPINQHAFVEIVVLPHPPFSLSKAITFAIFRFPTGKNL